MFECLNLFWRVEKRRMFPRRRSYITNHMRARATSTTNINTTNVGLTCCVPFQKRPATRATPRECVNVYRALTTRSPSNEITNATCYLLPCATQGCGYHEAAGTRNRYIIRVLVLKTDPDDERYFGDVVAAAIAPKSKKKQTGKSHARIQT
jgi:hypothetical protein